MVVGIFRTSTEGPEFKYLTRVHHPWKEKSGQLASAAGAAESAVKAGSVGLSL